MSMVDHNSAGVFDGIFFGQRADNRIRVQLAGCVKMKSFIPVFIRYSLI